MVLLAIDSAAPCFTNDVVLFYYVFSAITIDGTFFLCRVCMLDTVGYLADPCLLYSPIDEMT
jgi:hypothetical protein